MLAFFLNVGKPDPASLGEASSGAGSWQYHNQHTESITTAGYVAAAFTRAPLTLPPPFHYQARTTRPKSPHPSKTTLIACPQATNRITIECEACRIV